MPVRGAHTWRGEAVRGARGAGVCGVRCQTEGHRRGLVASVARSRGHPPPSLAPGPGLPDQYLPPTHPSTDLQLFDNFKTNPPPRRTAPVAN